MLNFKIVYLVILPWLTEFLYDAAIKENSDNCPDHAWLWVNISILMGFSTFFIYISLVFALEFLWLFVDLSMLTIKWSISHYHIEGWIPDMGAWFYMQKNVGQSLVFCKPFSYWVLCLVVGAWMVLFKGKKKKKETLLLSYSCVLFCVVRNF